MSVTRGVPLETYDFEFQAHAAWYCAAFVDSWQEAF